MEQENKSILQRIFEVILNNKFFIITVVVILLFRFYFIAIDIVVGESMDPTLRDEDIVIVDSQFYKINKLDRYDIIVFEHGETNNNGKSQERFLVKRIIGLPGETVSVKSGKLYINGKEMKNEVTDPFNTSTYDFESEVVPENHYFVLGDNRAVSLDSRSSQVGFVSEEAIRGQVIFRQKPLSEIGFVK